MSDLNDSWRCGAPLTHDCNGISVREDGLSCPYYGGQGFIVYLRTYLLMVLSALGKYSRTRLFRSHCDFCILTVISKVCYNEVNYYWNGLIVTQKS